MQNIQITEEQIIICDTLICDPVANYRTGDICCECPLLIIAKQIHQVILEQCY